MCWRRNRGLLVAYSRHERRQPAPPVQRPKNSFRILLYVKRGKVLHGLRIKPYSTACGAVNSFELVGYLCDAGTAGIHCQHLVSIVYGVDYRVSNTCFSPHTFVPQRQLSSSLSAATGVLLISAFHRYTKFHKH